jgi:hypothetical protein
MQAHVVAKFDVENWDESPFDDQGAGPKLTRALVFKRYTGDIEGTSTTEWLMAYAEDGSARFVGLERITGWVDGREGTLVLQHVGSYDGGAAKGSLDVVGGAGAGGLDSAAGTGQFLADPGGSVDLNLTFG